MPECSHLDRVQIDRPAEFVGCEQCLQIGSRWVHLRVCRSCGLVACCDSSPNRHASKHAADSGHPIVSSLEAGEDWSWCYEDEVAFILAGDGQRGAPGGA